MAKAAQGVFLLADDEFNDLVKRKFAEFERKKGRVPTIPELADSLDLDPRILARRLKKAIATLGTDTLTEGTSAFKSTLQELLSGDILIKGIPGFSELSSLLHDAKKTSIGYSQLRWIADGDEYYLSLYTRGTRCDWTLFGPRGIEFSRVTNDTSEVLCLLDEMSRGELTEEQRKRQIDGKSEEEFILEHRFELPAHEYQDPIPEDQLPPNVLPFRKPYQHSDE